MERKGRAMFPAGFNGEEVMAEEIAEFVFDNLPDENTGQ